MLVAVVSLLVIGPERLPKVARTLGAYTGRLQRYIAQVKDEVNREINFEDLQAMQQDIQAGVDEAKGSIRDGIVQVTQVADEVERSITGHEDAKPAKTKAVKKTAVKKQSIKKSAQKTNAKKKPAVKKKVVKKTEAKKTAVPKKAVD